MKKILNRRTLSLLGFSFFLPAVTFAQSTSCSNQLRTVADVFGFFVCLITKSIIPLLFAVAILVFIYGVVKYMVESDDEAKREESRKFMLWGIIALFVMISVWGLVGVLRDTFGLRASIIPQLQTH